MKKKLFFKEPHWILRKEIFFAIFALPILSFFLIGIFIYNNLDRVQNIKKEVIYLEKLFILLKEGKKDLQDENFIVNNLQTIDFLCREKEQLLELCLELDNKELYSGIKDRLNFFQSGENRLCFKSSTDLNNLIWDQKKTVEVNYLDLINLIAIIEGEKISHFFPSPHRPAMFISKLKWVKSNKSSDIYNLDMQIIQKR